MKLVINISEYNAEWIRNAYGIPQEINTEIAESIINGKPTIQLEQRTDEWKPIKDCPMRHENGNCLPLGGFCTANKNICEALHNAYEMGKSKQRTGKWIKLSRFKWIRTRKCDQCGNILDFDGVNAGRGDANFCPNCGTKMEGDAE